MFPLLAWLCICLVTPLAKAATANVTWTIDPRTQSYVNDQTKLAFRKSVAGFKLNRATPAEKDGGASFSYWGKHGLITVFLNHRGLMGCQKGDDCAAIMVSSYRSTMKQMHGKYDLEQPFALQRQGSARGRGALYHFLKSAHFRRTPVYSEVGAFQIGDFVYSYRATFMNKAGLRDLAAFLHQFGARKV